MQNLRYALRLLVKSPGFTAVAILTLALGIGVNSAIFSIVDAVMLRPLPYAQPENLYSVWETLTGVPPDNWSTSNAGPNPRVRMPLSIANFDDYEKTCRSLDLAAFEAVAMNLTESGPPERIWGERVSGGYFSVLGVAPAQGRAFVAEEQRAGNQHVVILSYELWQRSMGSDPDWASKSLTLEGEKYRIIGIMPAGFQSPAQLADTNRLEFLIPAVYPAAVASDRSMHQMSAVARLRPGATLERAQGELDQVSTHLERQFPASNRHVKTAMGSLSEDVAANARTSLLVMLGAVALVLLIACANIANLVLARAVGRQREIAIRFALGASRRRIVSELLVQSLLLALLGSVAGLLFGIWTRELVVRLAPAGVPRLSSAGLDARVLLFTLLLSLATGILFGLFPALHVSKTSPSQTLKESEHSFGGAGIMRWRSALMCGEIAVSMVLLVGAGLLLRSFVRLNGVDLGFDTQRVLAMRIDLPDLQYSAPGRRYAFFDQLAARVASLPGVQSVAFANRMPLRGGWSSSFFLEDGTNPETGFQTVSPGYFETLGIPLLRGRLLSAADREGSPLVAVVNSRFAGSLLAGRNAIGARFRQGPRWVTIVGVVGDIRREGKAADVASEVYIPATQPAPVNLTDFAFRAAGDPKLLINAVQREVWALDKNQPVTNVRTLEESVSVQAAQRRFRTLLVGLFAALALLLALVGVYGVVSYSVSQRTPEIGLRIALGAGRGQILNLVLKRSMAPVVSGVVFGAIGAYGLSRYLETLLFEIYRGDPLTYASIAVLLVLVALAACYIPAQRAAKVDPLIALRVL